MIRTEGLSHTEESSLEDFILEYHADAVRDMVRILRIAREELNPAIAIPQDIETYLFPQGEQGGGVTWEEWDQLDRIHTWVMQQMNLKVNNTEYSDPDIHQNLFSVFWFVRNS